MKQHPKKNPDKWACSEKTIPNALPSIFQYLNVCFHLRRPRCWRRPDRPPGRRLTAWRTSSQCPPQTRSPPHCAGPYTEYTLSYMTWTQQEDEPKVRVTCTVKVTSVKNTNTYVPRTIFTGAVFTSVGEVDPDQHVFGPPGSGSVSQRFGSGSIPFLIRVLSGLKYCLKNKNFIQKFTYKAVH